MLNFEKVQNINKCINIDYSRFKVTIPYHYIDRNIMDKQQIFIKGFPQHNHNCLAPESLIDHGASILEVHRSLFPQKAAFVRDKWLLSSAVQKLIRRGDAERVISHVITLEEVDPTYLVRRLPIIAVEDVGLGSVDLVYGVVNLLSTGRLSKKFSVDEQLCILVSLVDRLTSAVKSRAACDLLSLAMCADKQCNQLQKYFSLAPNELVAIATDRTLDILSRSFALYVLSGVTRYVNGRYQSASKFEQSALQQCAELLGAPTAIRAIVAKGRNTLGLAAMLPLAHELLELHHQNIRFFCASTDTEQHNSGWHPTSLPLFALDQYTRLGKKVFAELADTDPAFCTLLASAPKSKRSSIIGMAIFHVEGCLLNKRRTNDCLEQTRFDVERAELAGLGLPEADHQPLYDYLQLHIHIVDQRRSELLICSMEAI